MDPFRHLAIVIAIVITIAYDSTLGKDFLTLSHHEKVALDSFKSRVVDKLPNDYMKAEIYLSRFLRQTEFDVDAAEKLLMNMLSWRRENDIDKLLDEEYPEFDAEYPVYLEGCDNLNRPIISVPVGDWDIRKAIVTGLGPKLIRYMDKIYEDATAFLRTANAVGMEIVHVTLILDMQGFHAITHTCPRCLQLYLYFLGSLQTHYPGLIDKLYFVNTPDFVHSLWELYTNVLTPQLRKITTMYGRNKDEWKARIRSRIPPDQLSQRYGGDKPASLEFYYIRIAGQILSAPEQLMQLNFTNVCSTDLKIYENLINEAHNEEGFRKRKKCWDRN